MVLKLMIHSSKSCRTRTKRETVKFIPLLYLVEGQGNNNHISNELALGSVCVWSVRLRCHDTKTVFNSYKSLIVLL